VPMRTLFRRRKLLFLSLLLGGVVVTGTAGYMLITGASLIDAVYMTIISVTTVGFREVVPLSTAGKIFTIFLIITGLGIVFYVLETIVEDTMEGRIRKILGRRKMERNIAKMKNHVVVAGYGRMGEVVCRDLQQSSVEFIIIERDPQRFAAAEEHGYNVLNANATEEDALKAAGVEKARCLISLLSDDADNIFAVLSAREVNPALIIVTRAMDSINEKKLIKAGASRVVSPYELSSHRIVRMVQMPNVVDFFDTVLGPQGYGLTLEERVLGEKSMLDGVAIRDAGLREQFNAVVVAVRRAGEMTFNPSPDFALRRGDILIVIGEKEGLRSIG
jgi:voltage-gated potassium channel